MVYEGLQEINAQLAAFGFAALPEQESFSSYYAVDTAFEQTESWLYLFDFDTVLNIDIKYTDKTAAQNFIDAYIDSLEDYAHDAAPQTEEEDGGDYYSEAAAYLGQGSEDLLRFERLKEEDVYYKHSTPEGQKAFIYHFSEDGETLQMLFKSETFVPAQEMADDLNAAGFPVPDMAACASARDFRRFQKTMYGREYPLDYSVSFDFETAAQAAAFLENYIHILQDENDFDITNPQDAEINKNRAYVKEDGENRLIFGLDYAEGSVTVNVEFRLTENAAE